MESWEGNGRSHDESQAQGTEEHEGGVHDVQAPQEARQQIEREGRAQSAQEASLYRGPVRGRERLKRLDLTIASCQECPFLVVYTRDIKIDDETLESGFYCLYREPRRQDMTVVTHKQLLASGKKNNFREWMMENEGALVPRSCPLPDVILVKGPTGKRAIDIGD